MSSVLNNYAERTAGGDPQQSSSAAAPVEDQTTSPAATPETTSVAAEETPVQPDSLSASQQDSGTSSQPDRQLVSKSADKPASKPKKASRGSRSGGDFTVLRDIEERANTPKRLCSYRIPEGLDDWLEVYAFERRKQGVKKQDLVAEAIGLLIASKEGASILEASGEDD